MTNFTVQLVKLEADDEDLRKQLTEADKGVNDSTKKIEDLQVLLKRIGFSMLNSYFNYRGK